MIALRRPALAAGLLAIICLCSVSPAADRAPVPPAADVDRAQKSLKEVFKTDYAKTKLPDRMAFAAKMYLRALETTDDPAAKHAMLKEARDLAAKGGDPIAVLRVAEELTFSFDMNFAEAITPALDTLAAVSNSPVTNKIIAEVMLHAADEARFSGDWALALQVLKPAATTAARANSPATAEKIRVKVKDCELGLAELEKAKDALKAVRAKTADANATLVAGRYLVLVQQEFDDGMPVLAKCTDEKLKDAAEKDIKAGAGGDEDCLVAGDTWFDYAATADPAFKIGAQVRSHHWYGKCFARLTGLKKSRAEKRLEDLTAVVNTKADRTELWSMLRRAVVSSDLERGPVAKPSTAEKPFEEIPPSGGYLIGFNYAVSTDGRYIDAIQGIYMTPHGEVTGAVFSKLGGVGTVKGVSKAKPGYALANAVIRLNEFSSHITSIAPVYARVTETTIDTEDKYEGLIIGKSFTGKPVANDKFLVGFNGKFDRNGLATVHTISYSTKGVPLRPLPKVKP